LLDPVALDPLASTLERVGSHDHLCSIYQTEADRVAVASPFLRIGLGRREKCVYVHDDGAADAIAAKLVAGGVDVDGVIASGALVLKPKGEAYLRGGRFDPERMFAFWHREAGVARSQGYSGVRGASDTDWVLDKAPGVERWLEYEARLADELARCDCMLLCQYNRARYPPELLLGIIQTHPLVFYDGVVCRNYYHAPAAELLPPGEGARTVRRWLRNIREHAGRELGLRRGQETLERKQADLQHAHRRLEAQFDAVSQLYELSMRLIPQSDLPKMLDDVLDATIRLLKADLGSVHLYNSETQKLELATQRGFGPELVRELRELEPAAYRERLIVEDVRSDPAFVAMRPFAARAGFRALQSTPLFGRRAKLLGVISTHFLAPHHPAEGDLRMAELYSRCTADIIERMRTEDALRLSEERFRLMVEGVTDYAIFMLDAKGRVVSWNAGAQHIKGYRADEVLGEPFTRFYTPEAVEQGVPQQELAAASRDGRFAAEGCRVRKDGSQFWASVLITPMRDAEGRLIGFSEVTRDLSEIRRAEQELRHANERNAQILESITDMFIAFTKDFRFAYLNRHAAQQMRLVGKDPEQLIGKRVWDEFDDAPNEAAMRRVMNERVDVTDEVYYPPLGQWYENRMYPSSDGGMVVFVRNVTERKRRDEALRRSEAILEAAQRISHTGSWAWNALSGELFWSAEHYRIMGFEPQAVQPGYDMFFQRVHPDDRAEQRQLFEAAVRERRNYAASYRIVRPDGSIRHIRAEGHARMDESGTLIEYIGTVADFTERKESEEAVRRARDELAHINRALTVAELTASIAHELNQPLQAVVTNANAAERWLDAKPPNEAEARAALRRITRDANRAAEVIARIRGLLTGREAHKAQLRLGELIADVISLVESDARHKDIALTAVVEADLPPILADRVRIQQVLLNLLVNAMDVLGSAPAPRTVEVRASRSDGAVVVRVRDSGHGIEPKSLERVFQPFFSTKREGMGMGLAISRSIIEEHGGRIRALNNADGPGATLEFTLPLYT
jgi:PAS domain S-box-containing protein